MGVPLFVDPINSAAMIFLAWWLISRDSVKAMSMPWRLIVAFVLWQVMTPVRPTEIDTIMMFAWFASVEFLFFAYRRGSRAL